MNFLNPAAFAWGAIAFPIFLLYMLKLRRKEVVISSTFLWQRLIEDRQANTPWQRIQRNILLLLQLGVLTLLVVGLARPALDRSVSAGGPMIVLLDASASMQATDVTPSRFDAAVEEATQLVDAMGPDDAMTVILVSANPEIIAAAETDKSIISAGLGRAEVTSTGADWQAALAIAAGAYQSGEPAPTTVIISDGGLGGASFPPFPGELRYLPIGVTGENLGITAMAARAAGSETQLLTKVANYGLEERKAILSIYRDGLLVSARQLSVTAGQSQLSMLEDLPEGQAAFTAHLSSVENGGGAIDPLEVDNWGYTILRAPLTGRILLVSEGNFFLEQLLAAMPGVTAYRSLAVDSISQSPTDLQDFDLVIFDHAVPPPDFLGNILLLNPPPNNLFSITGSFRPELVPNQVTDHPLARDVYWDTVHIQSAAIISTPPWAEVLVWAGQNPLVIAGQHDNQRVAVLAFSLQDSDLPLQTAFPILFANLITYLLPGPQTDLPRSLPAGAGFEQLPLDTLETAILRDPAGEVVWETAGGESERTEITLNPGIYTISYQDGDKADLAAVAVNLFSDEEGMILPSASLLIGREPVPPHTGQENGQQEVWGVFALAAVLLLTVEWWIFHRGTGSLRAAPADARNR